MTGKFINFPIYILDVGTLNTFSWKEFLPDAKIILNIEEIFIRDSEYGAIVINSATKTSLSQELLLNLIADGAKICQERFYNGFYIDDYLNSYPLTTKIFDINMMLMLQTASDTNLPYSVRSFWVSSEILKKKTFISSNFEAQYYPPLLLSLKPYPVEKKKNYIFLFIVFILILIGIIFWLYVIIS